MFVDVKQKDLMPVSDWDIDSHHYYKSTSALSVSIIKL